MKNPFKIGSYLTLLLLFAVLYPLSVPAQRVGGKLLCRIPKNGERFTVEAVSVTEPPTTQSGISPTSNLSTAQGKYGSWPRTTPCSRRFPTRTSTHSKSPTTPFTC